MMGEVRRKNRKELVREFGESKRSHPGKEQPGVTLMWPCSTIRDKLGFGGVAVSQSRFHVEMASQVKRISPGQQVCVCT